MMSTSHKIRCCILCAAISFALLFGCAGHADSTTAWKKSFENSGAVVSISNCNAIETKSLFWADREGEPTELLTVEADGVPVMSVQGITPEELDLNFAAPNENGTLLYTLVKPVLNVDYRETQPGKDTVQYRLETVYTYFVEVKTKQGTDKFILKCTRQVG